MEEQPLWRRLFDAWDKEVGPRLEQLVRTEEFADRMAAVSRFNQRAQSAGEAWTQQMLRFWNLPSAADVEALRKHLGTIERQLRSINKKLTEVQNVDGRDTGS